MVKSGNNDELLDAWKRRVSDHSQMLRHPDEHRRDPVCKSSSHRSDDHKQQERADQSSEQRRYEQADHFRDFRLKENIQLRRHDADQERYDDAALKADQVNREPEDVKCCHFHGSLRCRTGIGQGVGQHDTADHDPHDRASSEPLDRTVRHAQRQEPEDRS